MPAGLRGGPAGSGAVRGGRPVPVRRPAAAVTGRPAAAGCAPGWRAAPAGVRAAEGIRGISRLLLLFFFFLLVLPSFSLLRYALKV